MKTDFDIRIHVELGVTPELTQLVKSRRHLSKSKT